MTSSPPPSPLVAHGLRKRYGDTLALDGFDLEVAPGTVHALLGPNGAGKSTAVNTFATLTRCDEGEALVAGHDVRHSPRQVRASIGLVGQTSALDEVLFGRENLVMFGRLHDLSKAEARSAPTSCSLRSGSRTPPTARSRRTRAGCAADSTSPPHW